MDAIVLRCLPQASFLSSLLSFPHAKINLGLHVIEKRPDGFHNLETCFYPIKSCCDALECIDAKEDGLKISGMKWDEDPHKNLVWRAFQLFRTYEPVSPKQWYLLKKIPTGGGLGGGSSDAAFALRMLGELAGWAKNDPRLFEMAAQLGSDCSCFLYDEPTMGKGRGEVLEPIALDLSAYRIELVFSNVHVSTAQAFAGIVPCKPAKSIRQILSQPIDTWRVDLVNDFETPVFRQYPQLLEIKKDLYRQGASYAAMSGSGSTLFGIFKSD